MSDRDIEAIPTTYKGVEYRSQLEGKWAIFFDTLGQEAAYEPRHFQIEGEGQYTPDFHLVKQRCWIEIKPRSWLQELERTERVARKLMVQIHEPVVILFGEPGDEGYAGLMFTGLGRCTIHYLTTCVNCGLLHWVGLDEERRLAAGPMGACCDKPQPLGGGRQVPPQILWAYGKTREEAKLLPGYSKDIKSVGEIIRKQFGQE